MSTPDARDSGRTARWWPLSFTLLALLWGATFMFVKVGLEALSPLQVAFGRVAFGAAFLVPVLLVMRDRLPRGWRVWGHLAVVALLFNSLPTTLIAAAETEISSIAAGIWNATTPLLTLVIALAMLPEERLSRERAAGMGVGFAGVVVLLGPWAGIAGGALLGNLAIFGAAASYGVAFAYTRRYLAGRSESLVSLSTAQLLMATAQLLVVLPLGGAPPDALPLDVVLSIVTMGALGTGLAYILNYQVIRAVGATIASTVTYVVPVVSTVLGIVVLGEALAWNQPLGAAIVIAGVLVAQGRGVRGLRSSTRRRTPDPTAGTRPAESIQEP